MEMAFIAPVFLTLVLGIIESSRLGMVSQLLTTAAREGCRVAVINGMNLSEVQNRVHSVLNGSGISVGTVTPTCPSPTCGILAERDPDHRNFERPLCELRVGCRHRFSCVMPPSPCRRRCRVSVPSVAREGRSRDIVADTVMVASAQKTVWAANSRSYKERSKLR